MKTFLILDLELAELRLLLAYIVLLKGSVKALTYISQVIHLGYE